MTTEFEEVLNALRSVQPEGERIAARLTGVGERGRVVDVLSDRPRTRVFAAPLSGTVEVIEGGVLIRNDARRPARDDLADTERQSFGNPLGGWTAWQPGYDSMPWFVPAPEELLVRPQTRVNAGDAFVACRCKLDHLMEVSGVAAVLSVVERELPELSSEDARWIVDQLTSHVEAYENNSDPMARGAGVLIETGAFQRHVGSADRILTCAAARYLDVSVIASLLRDPPKLASPA